MRQSNRAGLGLAVLTLAALSAAAHAGGGVIFSDTATSGTTFRSGDAPFTFISAVTTDTAISSFSIDNQMVTPGSLEFLILNDATGAVLYNSGSVAYGAEAGPTFKQSPTLTFTLLAGQTYDIGALANVSANYPFFIPGSFTQNGITSDPHDQNVHNFGAPSTNGHGLARIPIILNGSSPVPEASTTVSLGLLLALGLGGVLVAARKKKAGASI